MMLVFGLWRVSFHDHQGHFLLPFCSPFEMLRGLCHHFQITMKVVINACKILVGLLDDFNEPVFWRGCQCPHEASVALSIYTVKW